MKRTPMVLSRIAPLAFVGALMLVGSMSLGAAAQTAQTEELEAAPPGVEMLIKRGQIPAIFAPAFVPAAAANLPDDAWILGIHINGEAHAYSLNLLNHHEVVNDYVGGAPIAAVW